MRHDQHCLLIVAIKIKDKYPAKHRFEMIIGLDQTMGFTKVTIFLRQMSKLLASRLTESIDHIHSIAR